MAGENNNHDRDWGASVRTVIQGLILAGVVGLTAMVIQQGKDQVNADRDRSIQIATLQAQVAQVQSLVAGFPDLSSRVTKLEVNQVELIRRINRIEDGGSKQAKGWTR